MNWNLQTRVLSSYAASLTATLLIIVVATGALLAVSSAKDDVIDRDMSLVIDAHRLNEAMLLGSMEIRAYLMTGVPGTLQTAGEYGESFWEIFESLESRAYTEQGRRHLDAIRDVVDEYAAVTGDVIALRDAGADADEIGDVVQAELVPMRRETAAAIQDFITWEETLIDESQSAANTRMRRSLWLIWVLGITAIAGALGIGVATTRRVAHRVGELSSRVAASSSEVLAGSSQHVAGSSQQASAIQETVATVDELSQSADETARRSRHVAETALASSETAESGHDAIVRSVEGMAEIQESIAEVASGILSLAERAQAIAEITDTVNEVANQTNLLALNAAIEAARAGEHGRGFAVVAAEIRDLADETKQSTVRVGEILDEIQQATNRTVMATEKTTKKAADGRDLIEHAGQTIRELTDVISVATDSADQIVAAAGQQAGATSQISQAMREVNEVMEQGLASAREIEETARHLEEIARELNDVVGVKATP